MLTNLVSDREGLALQPSYCAPFVLCKPRDQHHLSFSRWLLGGRTLSKWMD